MATGFSNLRDVASSLPKGSVRSGVLFRSDAPFAGDTTPTIAGWPPVAVIDLRDPIEAKVAHPYGDSARVHVLPLLGAASPTRAADEKEEAERMLRVYRAMLKPRAAALLVQAIDVIANAEGPVLVHCAAGKDRTGVTVAFALRLCGIDRAAIMADYLLTDKYRDDLLKRLGIHYGTDAIAAASPHMLRTTQAGLDAVMDAWDTPEGGTVGWYLESGGDQGTLDKLRARMLPALPPR